jgi:hypothetical protein
VIVKARIAYSGGKFAIFALRKTCSDSSVPSSACC